MSPRTQITESDLHAYVDGELPKADHERVERFLRRHPGDADRMREYAAQKRALKALFDPVLEEPLPENLRRLTSPPNPESPQGIAAGWRAMSGSRRRYEWWQRIAAAIFVAAIGGATGWFARDRYAPTPSLAAVVPLPRQAAVAHAVYSPDVRRPVEVRGDQEEQLVTWLSKRIGAQVKAPKLGGLGYELVGGRLLPGNAAPVAQFMYQDATGQRLTLYVSTENVTNRETAFRFAQEGKVNVFYWVDGKFGYALSATIGKDELGRVASAVYDQLEKQ